jgi:hypothetical protein
MSHVMLTATLSLLSEFLIHAADVEGLCQGIDEELVESESACDQVCAGAVITNAAPYPPIYNRAGRMGNDSYDICWGSKT